MPIIENIVKNDAGQDITVRIEVPQTSKEFLGTDYGVNPDNGRVTRGGQRVTEQAQDAFKSAMSLIQTCATQISHTVQAIPKLQRPKECEVQFAVKIDGKVGAFIAESTVGAQIQVTLKWGSDE